MAPTCPLALYKQNGLKLLNAVVFISVSTHSLYLIVLSKYVKYTTIVTYRNCMNAHSPSSSHSSSVRQPTTKWYIWVFSFILDKQLISALCVLILDQQILRKAFLTLPNWAMLTGTSVAEEAGTN